MTNWTKEQYNAIITRGKNIIVSAGAGSGKTEVLSERVINNLLKKYMHINEMLILTFTKNAAFEMKTRIKKKILTHNEIIEEALLVDSADITNFDAYTLALVKKYHYELNLDPNISVIDSSIINKLKIDYLNEIIDKHLINENKTLKELITNFCNKNTTSLKEMIINLYNQIDLISNKEEYLNTYITNYYSDENINNLFKEYENNILERINIIKIILDKLIYECSANFYEKYQNILLPLLSSTTYESIRANLDIPVTRMTGATETGKKYKSQITNLIKEIKSLTIYPKETLINNVLNTKQNVEIIIDILNELSNKIFKFKKQNNSYEFNDISKFAIKLIKENNNLKEELKNHYKEIMIDEYQDTSDIQEEFINLIENNNVYMVGDIKQSIYRFRNANPNIFKDKYDLYNTTDKGIKIDLNKNFRSRKEVLDGINLIFNPIMDNKIGNANYLKEHNLIFGNNTFINEGNNNLNNDLVIYNYEKNNTNSQDEIEAFIIASDIKNKIENKYIVFDKQLRPCKYSDFCILLDRGSTFNTYRKVFDYLGIPLHIFQDEDILFEAETYLINNIIGLIINIKNNIYNEETKAYYTSIARSYLFNKTDKEIYECIKNNKIKESEIYNLIYPLTSKIDYLSNEEILEEIINNFDFYEKIILTGNITEKSIIINNLYNKFNELNKVGIDIYGINNYIKSLIKNNDKIKITAKHTNIDSVTLTNIHKSKGLEYKICYFSGFYKKFSILDTKSKIRFDNKYGIIFPDYKDGFINTFISDLNKEKFYIDDISEKIRLFYVALTRCKEKMIIVGNFKENDCYLLDNNLVDYITRSNYKSFNDIINSILPLLKNYIINIDTPSITSAYKIPKDYIKKEQINNNKTINVTEITKDEIQIEEEHYSKTSNKIITSEEKNNMEYGTHLHYLLEFTNFKDPDYTNLTKEETKIIKSLLSHPIMKDIQNAEIYKEYQFILENNNNTKTGIIDLIVEYKDHIDIIDYKLKNTLDTAYEKQLNGYKDFIKTKTNKEINIYLYSLLNQTLTKVNSLD